MGKFIKYEIKGTYKFILGILVMLLIASTIIQLNISNEIKNFDYSSVNGEINFMRFMFFVSTLVIFGAAITAFFYIVGSFRKELYEDRGYLTFTLPLTGNQIVGTKLIVAFLWYFVLGAAVLLYNILLAIILFGGQWMEIFKDIFNTININTLSFTLISLLSAVTSLILIYFSIALSKVSIRNKKIGGLWFILFLVLSAIVAYIVSKVNLALPYYLDLNTFKLAGIQELSMLDHMSFSSGTGRSMVLGLGQGVFSGMYINIFGTLTQLIIGIATFIGTGYLIEKKIDL
ncbi:hypothetical protein [Wansuia hejianensis]|uniref:ABC-2 family transporter n=1 Tax=Wansuia hejianensis TaxID=2763667 RepID=A0A926EWU5_9FIRM|nr:hypothetical protein [Wansuia hejianensis]MBC8589778.1 hypothetical protein [Wansuia hejianensis]